MRTVLAAALIATAGFWGHAEKADAATSVFPYPVSYSPVLDYSFALDRFETRLGTNNSGFCADDFGIFSCYTLREAPPYANPVRYMIDTYLDRDGVKEIRLTGPERGDFEIYRVDAFPDAFSAYRYGEFYTPSDITVPDYRGPDDLIMVYFNRGFSITARPAYAADGEFLFENGFTVDYECRYCANDSVSAAFIGEATLVTSAAPAPVPLPAGAGLLAFGLVALRAARGRAGKAFG